MAQNTALAGDESTEVIDEVTGNQGKDTMLDEAKAHGLIGGAMGGMGGARWCIKRTRYGKRHGFKSNGCYGKEFSKT